LTGTGRSFFIINWKDGVVN